MVFVCYADRCPTISLFKTEIVSLKYFQEYAIIYFDDLNWGYRVMSSMKCLHSYSLLFLGKGRMTGNLTKHLDMILVLFTSYFLNIFLH